MPNRVLKESIKRSPQIDSLTWFEEVTFYRLIVSADDYGNQDGRPIVVRNVLFPTKDSVTVKSVENALDHLEGLNLIRRYIVDGVEYIHLSTWEAHQRLRNSRHGFPPPPQDAASCGELRRVAANSGLNPIQSESNPNPNPNPTRTREDAGAALINDSDARTIQGEHDRILTAAEDAGFPRTNSARAGLLQLYARYGMDRLLYGISECVKYGASNLAYLEKCCEGGKKQDKQAKGRTVNAQQYEQRSYEAHEESVDEIMARLARGG